jgi:predicted unusual protein kinase regulating ubiquinone biosynthesis (AarF/ABC1/UbiB family)
MRSSPTDKISRLARLGRLTSRVTGSYVGQKVADVFRNEEDRHRALERLHIDNARQIVETVGKLKGAAMKIGQQLAVAASTMDMPPEAARLLGKLHNEAEPVPFSIIRADIEASLERPLTEAFAWFDENPLGTASLGQAHLARLHDGRDVVVKVLHRGVDDGLSADLMALKAMLIGGRVLMRDKEELDAIFDELKDRLEEETDYLHEAANILLFERLWGHDERLRIPRVHPKLSSERVLTMDRLPGVGIAAFVKSATPAARQRAGETLADLYFRSVYEHRALHADPHPGNYLFEPDGRVGLLDFGCVKRFDEYWLAHYARAAIAAIDLDKERCLAECRELGGWVGDTPEAGDRLWAFVDLMAAPFRRDRYVLGGPEDTVMDRIPDAVRSVMRYPEIRAPRDLIMLHRSLVGMYALARELVTEGNWGRLSRGYAEHAIRVAQSWQVP